MAIDTRTCASSGTLIPAGITLEREGEHGQRRYTTCPTCGKRVGVTSWMYIRKHQMPR